MPNIYDSYVATSTSYSKLLSQAIENNEPLRNIQNHMATNVCDPNYCNEQGLSLLQLAAYKGRHDVVQALLKMPGIDVNYRGNRLIQGLWIAAALAGIYSLTVAAMPLALSSICGLFGAYTLFFTPVAYCSARSPLEVACSVVGSIFSEGRWLDVVRTLLKSPHIEIEPQLIRDLIAKHKTQLLNALLESPNTDIPEAALAHLPSSIAAEFSVKETLPILINPSAYSYDAISRAFSSAVYKEKNYFVKRLMRSEYFDFNQLRKNQHLCKTIENALFNRQPVLSALITPFGYTDEAVLSALRCCIEQRLYGVLTDIHIQQLLLANNANMLHQLWQVKGVHGPAAQHDLLDCFTHPAFAPLAKYLLTDPTTVGHMHLPAVWQIAGNRVKDLLIRHGSCYGRALCEVAKSDSSILSWLKTPHRRVVEFLLNNRTDTVIIVYNPIPNPQTMYQTGTAPDMSHLATLFNNQHPNMLQASAPPFDDAANSNGMPHYTSYTHAYNPQQAVNNVNDGNNPQQPVYNVNDGNNPQQPVYNPNNGYSDMSNPINNWRPPTSPRHGGAW